MTLPSSPHHRLRPRFLLAMALLVFALAALWGWAFVGDGRARFRQGDPTASPEGAAPSLGGSSSGNAPAAGTAPPR